MIVFKEDIADGRVKIPKWYGLAYKCNYDFLTAYYPYPFNWIMKFWHKYLRIEWIKFVVKLFYDLGLRNLCKEGQSKAIVLWDYIFGDIRDTEANDKRVARILERNKELNELRKRMFYEEFARDYCVSEIGIGDMEPAINPVMISLYAA